MHEYQRKGNEYVIASLGVDSFFLEDADEAVACLWAHEVAEEEQVVEDACTVSEYCDL